MWREALHLEPPTGWMNDPNGLSWFKGKYHVYFQYTPEYATGEGLRCWGHYESEDLLNFVFTGTVLKPDIPEDRTGVFSGSAMANGDKLEIFYTGNVEIPGYDLILEGREANEIHVTTEDGVTMSEKKVVLRNSDYPDYCSCHVRDPKVWVEGDKWKMVLGARTKDDHGLILIYEADKNNLDEWKFVKKVDIPDFGFMWECPDIFEIDGKHFLSLSPQGIGQQEYKWQNVFSVGYFKYDPETDSLTEFTEWDRGFDFYAQQTFKAPDGRRILIGWMGGGGNPYTNPTTELGWQHCLTIPRELTLDKDGFIIQNPIREFEKLRESKEHLEDETKTVINTVSEILINVDKNLRLKLGSVELKIEDNLLTLIHLDKGYGRDIRKVKGDFRGGLRVIIDNSSIECFVADGKYVLGTRFYPDGHKIDFEIEGSSADIYSLRALGVTYYENN